MNLNSRERFLRALNRQQVDKAPVANPNSLVTTELQRETGAQFPDANRDPSLMAQLAAGGHEICGYDVVFPVFGAGTHEIEALGVHVNWGDINNLPSTGPSIWKDENDIEIPSDFLKRPSVKVVLDAIRLLKEKYQDRVGIIGKVYGPWSLSYYLFGMENFLIWTITDPQRVTKILNRLKEIPLIFAEAQIEAGIDALNCCDHITADLCAPKNYPDYLLTIHQEMSQKISVPLILHCCGKTLDRIEYFNQNGMECYNFESKNDAQMMRQKATMVLLGNINNKTILEGTKEEIEKEVFYAIDAGVEIIGPECAVPVNGKLENITAIREAVDKYYQ